MHNLEAITGGQGQVQQGSTAAKYPPLDAFDALVKDLTEAATHTTEAALKDVVLRSSYTFRLI